VGGSRFPRREHGHLRHTPDRMAIPARWLAVAVLLTGCVTGQASPPRAPHVAQAEAECEVFVARPDGREVVDAALHHGALSSLYLMIRGAAAGAFWGAVGGGGAADGAWIGAAAGAGLGAIVGVVEGVERGLAEQRRYRAAFEGCVASRLSAREPDDHD
jgi:hypothetical protein